MDYKKKSKEYLDSILKSRYNDGVDRADQKVFDGKDIMQAYIMGAKELSDDLMEFLMPIVNEDDLNMIQMPDNFIVNVKKEED